VLIFSIFNHPCCFMVFFDLCKDFFSKLLVSGFLRFEGNSVRGQNNANCRDWVPFKTVYFKGNFYLCRQSGKNAPRCFYLVAASIRMVELESIFLFHTFTHHDCVGFNICKRFAERWRWMTITHRFVFFITDIYWTVRMWPTRWLWFNLFCIRIPFRDLPR